MIPRCYLMVLFISVSCSHAGLEWDSKTIKLKAEPFQPSTTVEFLFKNAGSDTIRIEKVATSCSCTTATIGEKIILPGRQGVVRTTFAFGAREGLQRKRFVVFTSNGDRVSLYMTVDIPRTYSITPRRLTWTSSDNSAAKSCRMLNESNVPIKIASAKSSNPAFMAEIREFRPGFEYEILVTPNGAAASSAIISIATEPLNGHKPRSYQIHVLAR